MTTMTTNFSVSYCKSLKFKDQLNYIEEYFIPLNNGNHAFKISGKWTLLDDSICKNVYFNRLSPSINEYYFKEYDRILRPIYDKSKAEFFDDCVNLDYKAITLRTHYWFIIDEFIDKNVEINLKPKDIYDLYDKYFDSNIERNDKLPKLNKTQFISALNDVGIKSHKSGTNIFKISHNDLFNIGIKNEWFVKDVKDIEIDMLKSNILKLNDAIDLLKNENEKLKEENEEYMDVEYCENSAQCDLDEEMNIDDSDDSDEFIENDECMLDGDDLVLKL